MDYSVLTLRCHRDIIIKSPHDDAENSKSAGAAWKKHLKRRQKKSQKISEKVLTKEIVCDIILKLSERDSDSILKIEQCE